MRNSAIGQPLFGAIITQLRKFKSAHAALDQLEKKKVIRQRELTWNMNDWKTSVVQAENDNLFLTCLFQHQAGETILNLQYWKLVDSFAVSSHLEGSWRWSKKSMTWCGPLKRNRKCLRTQLIFPSLCIGLHLRINIGTKHAKWQRQSCQHNIVDVAKDFWNSASVSMVKTDLPSLHPWDFAKKLLWSEFFTRQLRICRTAIATRKFVPLRSKHWGASVAN